MSSNPHGVISMAMYTSPPHGDTEATAENRRAVQTLVHAGETAEVPASAAPRAGTQFGPLLLLSANPDGGEPIEDAHGGVVQNLACARAF
ncbi:hypothetical protein GCM10009799_38160 [Nocardiopsis rhodophaea]|uniref:Uncharacterized protein n=1 Tax=Nocardiopsis rhodophaea TaxID=280238 RepID=A0ABN2TF99_9ACTN